MGTLWEGLGNVREPDITRMVSEMKKYTGWLIDPLDTVEKKRERRELGAVSIETVQNEME